MATVATATARGQNPPLPLLGPTLHWGQVRLPGASLVAHMVNVLPEMQEKWVGSLGREDPMEEEITPHFSILVWKISWAEDPGGLQSMQPQRFRLTKQLNAYCLYRFWRSFPDTYPRFF